MALPFPAFGKGLAQRRMKGDRPRVIALMVGSSWKVPKYVPPEVPRLGVKPDAWHKPIARRFDWRIVGDCSVLAIDTRMIAEIELGSEGWDSWLWLLSDVRRFARDVQMFTPTIDFQEAPGYLARERDLDTYAFCYTKMSTNGRQWPPWWSYGDALPQAAA